LALSFDGGLRNFAQLKRVHLHRREISRSVWPTVAEKLLDLNVRILDGDGIAWRRRLQTANAPKRRAKRPRADADPTGSKPPAKRRRGRRTTYIVPVDFDFDEYAAFADMYDFDMDMDSE
jgi:hypothetical protein